jgi:DNA repair protein RadC
VNIHLTSDQLPREKLLRDGPEVLSDVELLAIFLGTGTRGQSVLALAGQLIEQFGDLRGLLDADAERVTAVSGMGPAKYASLRASQELSVRYMQSAAKQRDVIIDPNMTRRYLCAKLRHQEREVFACLYLDNQHRLISYEELFYGTIDGASIHPREVVKRVLYHNAAAAIFAHNHPSGVAEPSSADKRITERLQSALMLIDVRVLDHMVVGDVEVVSFAERGLL